MKTPSRLPVRRAAELDADPQAQRWLIEHLWTEQAVGLVVGHPKSCKSFLALEMAVAVASGAPCLRRFPPGPSGPVLLFAAEDPLHVVRRRLQGIARAAGVDFETLDIHVITAPTLRLDLEEDRQRLQATVDSLQPKLLVLDPFVRLHRADENSVADVAPLLGYLRQLQRTFHTAVLLVHHARKDAAGARAGQALRGSSEMYAWGDCLLYLRRGRGDLLQLSVEHRAAASLEGLSVQLTEQGEALALQLVHDPSDRRATDPHPPSTAERIEHVLRRAPTPLSLRQVRQACRLRMSTVARTLATLTAQGRVTRQQDGFRLAEQPAPFPGSRPSRPPVGNGDGKHRPLGAEHKLQLLPGETESGSARAQPDKG